MDAEIVLDQNAGLGVREVDASDPEREKWLSMNPFTRERRLSKYRRPVSATIY